MTLNQLRYFKAVCQYDSVSRAAQQLNISQPSVSNAIKELESEFGVSLFNRQYRRISLTDAGLQLLSLTEKLLQQADQLQQAMADLRNSLTPLRLGVPPMIGAMLLPTLYKHFPESRNLRLTESDNTGLLQLLSGGQIHMAFLPHTDTPDPSLMYVPVANIQNICCVHKDHPLAGRSTVQIGQLAGEPLVLFQDSFFQTERILHRFSAEHASPNVLLSTAQLSTVKNMIAGNTAVGFLFDFLAAQDASLVGIPLDPPMYTNISLVWPAAATVTESMGKLISFVKKLADNHLWDNN